MSNKLEEKLANTQKELDNLKAEYQEFIYVVSHDLRAPLRQIIGFAEIIAEKHVASFDDKSKRHVDLIVQGAEKANHLLDTLVDYSRVDTQANSFTAINCNVLMEEVKQTLSELIDSSDAQITLVNLPEIVGDRAQISEMFYQLLHNALHYQHPGNKPQITIKAEDKQHLWQFCIEDNGIGIQTNIIEKVFKVLRRGVSDKKYSGIGIGLPTAKKILTRHGGELWLAQPQERGSCFYFTLPKEPTHE